MFAAYVRVNVAVRSVVQIVVHHVEYLVASLSLEEDVQVEVPVSHRHRYAEDEVGQRRTEISAVLSGDASVVVQVFEAEVSWQGGLFPVVLSGVILCACLHLFICVEYPVSHISVETSYRLSHSGLRNIVHDAAFAQIRAVYRFVAGAETHHLVLYPRQVESHFVAPVLAYVVAPFHVILPSVVAHCSGVCHRCGVQSRRADGGHAQKHVARLAVEVFYSERQPVVEQSEVGCDIEALAPLPFYAVIAERGRSGSVLQRVVPQSVGIVVSECQISVA